MNKRVVSIVLILVMITLVFASMSNASSMRLLRTGSRGADVKKLQQALNSKGHSCGNADGIFGKRTHNSVRSFQRKNGLTVDGIVGKDTRNKLYSGSSTPSRGGETSVTKPSKGSVTSNPTPIRGTLRRGSRGSQVRTLQTRLNQLGYKCGKVDGIFGNGTYNAVVRFQRAKRLGVDGIVGKNTVDKLYPKTTAKPIPKPTPKPDPKPTPKPEPTPEQMYRVRKDWNDSASQLGAYRILDGARDLADKNPGYKVFDSSGKIVYEPDTEAKEEPPIGEFSILSKTRTNVAKMQNWARGKNATQTFIDLAPIYRNLAPKIGVNPEGAYVQAAHETGYGRFGGVIDETYNNPCGLKVTAGGGNYDPNAHHRFESWEQGVQAHVDHLALYAGAPGYPKADSPDPRHFPSICGKATTFKALGGRWAPSATYGDRIENLIQDIYNTN